MKYIVHLLAIYLLVSVTSANELALSNSNEYAPSFSNRFSLQAGANPNARQLSSITNFNFSYAYKRSSYWLDFNAQTASGLFNKMSANNSPATGLTDDQLFNTNATHSSAGVGLMVESSYSSDLFSDPTLYETSSAYLTYNIFSANAVSSSFSGPGLITKFSICKKYSDYFSVGANLNYLLASVKRSATNSNETSSDLSLTVSYLTLGIDLILTL